MKQRKIIQEMVEASDYKMKKLREGKKWLTTPPMKKILDSLDYLAEKHNARISTYFDGGWNSVYLTLGGLNGLKDEGLSNLLNSMIHHEPDESSNEDNAGSYARTYKFAFFSKDPEFYGRLTVNITANFKEDSDTCKRVIVGYTEPSNESTPIYELRCEDAPLESQE